MTVVGTHAQGDLSLRVRDYTGLFADEGPVWFASIGQTHDVVANGYGHIGSLRAPEGEAFGATKLAAVDAALTMFVERRIAETT